MKHSEPDSRVRSTTILAVRRDGSVAIGGDGQVSLGPAAIKHEAAKIRPLSDGKVLCGFAGSAADAFALLERLEVQLDKHKTNVKRAVIELAKQWRMDRVLRRLDSLLVVISSDTMLLVGGGGDVIEPDDGIIGIGSGGMYAMASARSLLAHTDLSAERIVEEALRVAAGICVYTNDRITVSTLSS